MDWIKNIIFGGAKSIGLLKGNNRTVALNQTTHLSFALIPAGNFIMGSRPTEEGHDPLTEAQHEVTISRSFWMGKTTITQKQWVAVMGVNPSHKQGDDLPVGDVPWDNIQVFIEKLNELQKGKGLIFRLPTSAEWEFACRAGTQTRFSSGDSKTDLDKVGWFKDNSSDGSFGPRPVALKKPNAWGLHDMHGNVWEWCADNRRSTFVGCSPDVIQSSAPETDPFYSENSRTYVLRGGNFVMPPELCRSACISGEYHLAKNMDLGFRLAAYSENEAGQKGVAH